MQDAGYDSEAEELSEMEMDYSGEDSIMMRVFAYYYSPENRRGENGKHTISLFGDVNLESPYHRAGNLDDSIEITFTFNSLDELSKKMDSNLLKIVGWFNGDNYNNSKKEMKVRRMADGGKLESEINELYKKSNFINDDFNWKLKLLEMLQDNSIEAYNIYQTLTKEQKEQVLQEQFEVDNDMGSDGDGDIETSKENIKILLEDAKNGNKYAKGGNLPSIEKRVAEVNALIKEGNDKGVEVYDESTTWQSATKYNPIKYSNGVLYVSYMELDLYKYRKSGGRDSQWKKENYRIGKNELGVGFSDNSAQRETLTDVARMYRKAINHFDKYGYADGGKTQGYDDREDERLAMKYGKMSGKDLNSTKARRDDARFEERGKMADGGMMAKGGEIRYKLKGNNFGQTNRKWSKIKNLNFKSI